MTNTGFWVFIICLILCFVAFGSFIVYWLCKGMERRERIITVVKANVCVFGFLFSLLVTYDLLDMGDFSSFAVVDAAIAFGIGCIWAGIFVKWCDERPNSFIRGSRGRR